MTMISRAHILWLWVANTALLILVVLAFVLSDANSRLPGLDETPSVAVVAFLVGMGVLTDIYLGWCDRKRWPVVVAVGVVYIALLIPLVA